MQIVSIRHKSLRAFANTGNPKGLPGNLVERLRNMIAWLNYIRDADQLLAPPNFGAHLLKGDRAGRWSLTVTKNWRMTFRVTHDSMIEDLDLEDYH